MQSEDNDMMASFRAMVLDLRSNIGSDDEELTDELDEFLGEMTWIMRPVFSENDRLVGAGELPLSREEENDLHRGVYAAINELRVARPSGRALHDKLGEIDAAYARYVEAVHLRRAR